MPTTYKILGQSVPEANSNTNLYTVPLATQAVCSTISICNRGATTNFRLAFRPEGASLSNEHFIVFDNYVEQYDSVMLTLGVTLAANDIVTVYTGANTMSFSLFGAEIT